MSVEIADPRVFEPMQYSPIFPTDTIYPVWDAVCDAILDLDIQGCRAVECFRYGRDTNDQNPQMVIVTVSPSVKNKFKQTREQIVGILNHFQLQAVGVSIVKGEIERSDTFEQWRLPQDGPKEGGHAGLSLGKRGISTSSGTFGGWVEIQDATGEWLRLGLTCFHCVDPTKQANIAPPQFLTRWYTHGISANDADAKKYLRVDQPSMHDIKNDLAILEKFIKSDRALLQAGESVNQPDMKEYERIEALLRKHMVRKSHIEQFCASENHHLGHVYAGSGYREKPVLGGYSSWETTMDWALIDVKDQRVRDNDITVHGTPVIPSIEGLTTLKGWDMAKLLDKYRSGGTECLYKIGQSTGFTAGWYNSIKSIHVATRINQHGKEEMKVTKEHAILGRSGQRFAAPGDSGSFVFTEKGEVVGMIFAGRKDRNISYFTHISHLFEDIKAITGCIGVRIYA
ncbi:predicted protein [Uncinocarpus reesii 1704]|uniref:Peptidase S1 domain-containing protein n=1 Tax=Uncinocarpus reesii (strain UAMH 1704) TaxID=336963 RepID=C4JFI6_UNCRE|nr:uncharacterized protein UREG_01000 [Uncinocarpus reesii 1704]EEP76151.1 predicted protein [Uncinocarpus reesii 1704]